MSTLCQPASCRLMRCAKILSNLDHYQVSHYVKHVILAVNQILILDNQAGGKVIGECIGVSPKEADEHSSLREFKK